MALPVATLDHVVINARDDMDRAAEIYRKLGFTLTERGYHSLGSMNHLAMFGTDYLELIAVPKNATTGRLDLLNYSYGLNGLVFGSEDSAVTYAELEKVMKNFADSIGRSHKGYSQVQKLQSGDYLSTADLTPLTRNTLTDPQQLRDRIRAAARDGYSIVEDELAIGILALAVPITDRHGRVVAALNCSAHTGDVSQEDLLSFLPLLTETAARISQALSHFPALTVT